MHDFRKDCTGFGFIEAPPWQGYREGKSGERAAAAMGNGCSSYVQATYFLFGKGEGYNDTSSGKERGQVGKGISGDDEKGLQVAAASNNYIVDQYFGKYYYESGSSSSSSSTGGGTISTSSTHGLATSSITDTLLHGSPTNLSPNFINGTGHGAASTPSFSSSALIIPWGNLDSPDSCLLDLDSPDIDDSWLDSLPLVNTSHDIPRVSSPLRTMNPKSSPPAPDLPLVSIPDNPLAPATEPSYRPSPATPVSSITRNSPSLSTPRNDTSSNDLATERKRPKRFDLSEPKYVVLTRNYESVLKDGFKWRKYGQKSVKNNIYPRSYYKCSYEGCHVHKHVERLALDPCLILTTYRGRHTH